MNVFTFTGHLGKDCVTSTTQSGTSVCEFSVAVSSGYGDREKTTWVRCALFGKRAEGSLPQYLAKGQKVAVSGELTLDEWEKDGVKNSMLKVNVNSLDLIGQKSDGQHAAQHASGNRNQDNPTYQQAPQTQGFDDFTDDTPF